MILGGLSAATLAAGLAWAAPVAQAHDRGHEHGGHAGGGDHGPHGDAPSHLDLPNGFRPEGIATGRHHTAYLGSLADGDIYALDLRSGEGRVISEGPGTPSVGLKLTRDLLYVAGGSAGNARVIGVRSGEVLATYALAPAGTPSFINDVVLTRDSAWFTDSLDNALYRIPLGHHHSHQSLPGQGAVEKVDLGGAWVQGPGNNANGITTTPDKRALLVVNSSNGLLYRVDGDGVATQVDLGGYVVTNGDGLLREGRTLYAVQNRLNQVAVFELDRNGARGELRRALTSPDFDVPTTIARSGGDLYLPNARFTTPPTPTTAYWVTGIDG
jgi:sugar lactone lactonase YvrE